MIVEHLELMGFEVEAAHHEVAPGQHEIDFRYADALTTADNIATFKFVVRDVAHRHGFLASFMPKPIQGQNGSGMHTHQSLFRGKENAFFDPKSGAPALEGGAELHRGPAAARARLLRHHQPADQQLQAAGAGLRGAGQRRVVACGTARRWSGSRTAADSVPAASSACPIRRPIPTWRSRCSSPRDSTASRRSSPPASR